MASVRVTGYPVDIFLEKDKIEDFICAICTDVCRDAVETTCTHIFCKPCLMTAMEVKEECPLDHAKLAASSVREAGFVRRKVQNLRVRCINHSAGCKHQSVLRDLKKHIPKCAFARVNCNLCRTVMRLKELEKHMESECPCRSVSCEHCDAVVQFDEMKNHVTTQCMQVTIPCPNNCGTPSAPRTVIAEHLKTDCPTQVVPCSYRKYGCDVSIERQHMQQHLLKAAYHLQLVESHVAQRMDEIQKENLTNLRFAMQMGSLDRFLQLLETVDFKTSKKAIPKIIRGMIIFAEDTYIQERCCYALIQLSEVNNKNAEKNIEEIVAHRGIATVVDAMKKHPDHVKVQEYALHVLRKMATNMEVKNFVQRDTKSDCIGQILRTMSHHRANVGIQRDALGVLLNMAVNDHIENRIGSLGGVQRILSAMDRFRDSANLEQLACHALFHLTFDNENKDRLMKAGAPQRMVGALQRHPRHAHIAYYCLRALAQLSKIDEYHDKLRRLGVVELTQKALRLHSHHQDLQKKGNLLLQRLDDSGPGGGYAAFDGGDDVRF